MPKRTRRCVAAVVAVAALAVGCQFHYPSNAPPVRTGGYGAPDHVEGRELSGGVSPSARFYDETTVVRLGVDPSLVFGITDTVAIELGGSYAVQEQAMGFGGIRLTIPRSVTHGSVAIDFGFGGGGGTGGAQCGNGRMPKSEREKETEDEESDESSDLITWSCDGGESWDGKGWLQRTAYGGYFDVGFSWWLRWPVAVFWRPRVQVSGGENLPVTLWFDVVVGPHVKSDKIDFHFGLAPTIYHTEWETRFLLGLEFGLSYSSKD
jgi:hypothetical protein